VPNWRHKPKHAPSTTQIWSVTSYCMLSKPGFAMVIAAQPAGQPCPDRDRRSLNTHGWVHELRGRGRDVTCL
jgi:hypothetical protein